ncbi:hypothetical protein B0T26DRAFT_640838, partial [Lasiosphaeria miniovina]
ARWCADMAAAVAHTHGVAHTYHKDIKPNNFVIDDDDNLVLCDWEQSDVAFSTLASEADGTWDVAVTLAPRGLATRPLLTYSKYAGPPRRSMEEDVVGFGDKSWHAWNAFRVWSEDSSLALPLELTEVFSLGRSMWMLLCQAKVDLDDVERAGDIQTTWENGGEDIPAAWKRFVDRCLVPDPNYRPDVLEVVDFWKRERAINHS